MGGGEGLDDFGQDLAAVDVDCVVEQGDGVIVSYFAAGCDL